MRQEGCGPRARSLDWHRSPRGVVCRSSLSPSPRSRRLPVPRSPVRATSPCACKRCRSGRALLAAAQSPMHFNMLALHWIGSGSVSYRVHRLHGGWSAWVTADADVAPDGGTGPLARRQPRLDRSRRRRAVPAARGCAPAARVRALVAGHDKAVPADQRDGHACDRLARRLGRRRGDRAREAAHRARRPARGRAPHRGHELVHGGPGGGDRARHRGLPREGKRLERHRLQLFGRPVRDRLRGPRRRHRQERDRRALAKASTPARSASR